MIRRIAAKEFRQNLLTKRFIFGTLILIVFMAAAQITLSDEQAARVRAYEKNAAENEESLKGFHTYSMIVVEAIKPPAPLALFAEGISRNVGDRIAVRRQAIPFQTTRSLADNPFLDVFESLDLILIFKLVLSVLALLFSYDMFSGEKERGTLKLVVAAGASRAQVFFGKFVGGLLSLTAAFAMSLFAGVILLAVVPLPARSGDLPARIGLLGVATLIYMAAFFSIGALISALHQKSRPALTVSAAVWMVLVIILPNLGNFIASRVGGGEPENAVQERIGALTEAMVRRIDEVIEKAKAEGGIWINGAWNLYSGEYEVAEAPRKTMAFLAWYIPWSESLRNEREEKISKIRNDHRLKLLAQAETVNMGTVFSPVRLYENIASILSQTDIKNHLGFLEQARRYREQILRYFEDENVYSRLRFWTIMEAGEADAFKIGDPDPSRTAREMFSRRPPLDLSDFPRFRYQPSSLGADLLRCLPYGAGLFAVIMALVLGAYLRFRKYDVR